MEKVAAAASADPERLSRVWTISDLAAEFSVTPRTIRFYEDEGLIHPARRGTQRLYSKSDRARLQWILRGRNVGFSLGDIRDLLDLYRPNAREGQMRAALEKCRDRVTALEAQRADIDATIAELSSFCDTLQSKLES